MTAQRPGWFDDPNDATLLRYWDGNKWTEYTAPRSAPPSGPPRLSDMPPPSAAGQASTGPTSKMTQSARWAALPARKRALFVGAGLVALVGFLALGNLADEDGDSNGNGNPTLSEAFCNDVKDGASPYQMYASVPDRWDDMRDFAGNAYGMMAISCPSELEGWRWFFEEYNINIDA